MPRAAVVGDQATTGRPPPRRSADGPRRRSSRTAGGRSARCESRAITGPSAAAQQPLGERRAGRALDHRAVEEQRAARRRSRASPSMSRAISSVATEVPMSWPTRKTGRPACVAADQLLGDVGLLDQRVVVVRAASRRARSRGSRRRAPRGPGSRSSSRRQSYELDGKPWSSSSSGPSPSRRKTWIRRPPTSSSAPRARHALDPGGQASSTRAVGRAPSPSTSRRPRRGRRSAAGASATSVGASRRSRYHG